MFSFHPLVYSSKVFSLSLLCIFFFSCEEKPTLNTKKISQEIKERKIKRISQADILEIATHEGNGIITKLEKNWIEALNKGIENKGIEYSKKFCIVPFIPGYDTIFNNYIIKKAGKDVKKNIKMDTYEQQILEAYLYNIENKLPVSENVQKLADNQILYTSPIFVKDQSCLKCHNSDAKNLSSFNIDEFAGLWSVRLPTKQLLQDVK